MKNSTRATMASANRTGWTMAPPAIAITRRMIPRISSICVHLPSVGGSRGTARPLPRTRGLTPGHGRVRALAALTRQSWGGRVRRVPIACLLAVTALAALAAPALAAPPPIKHVFVIALENKGFDATFGPGSPAPYLSQDLPAQGQLLTQYYGIGHASLDNYVALVSGQAPNIATQSDCPFFFNFAPAIAASNGQYIGQGCVYPTQVKTVADQLTAAGLTWKGYMEDMGTPCRHPAVNGRDGTQQARANDQYAARHNPFVYFHSIIDSPSCAQNDVPLEQLESDLQSASTTASYSFITPDLCHDAHD